MAAELDAQVRRWAQSERSAEYRQAYFGGTREDIVPVHDDEGLLGLSFVLVHQILEHLAV